MGVWQILPFWLAFTIGLHWVWVYVATNIWCWNCVVIKTHQAERWESLRVSCVADAGNSEKPQKVGFVCFDFRPRSHRTRRCSQTLLAQNGTDCCQWECSHSMFVCKPAYASCVNWALGLIHTGRARKLKRKPFWCWLHAVWTQSFTSIDSICVASRVLCGLGLNFACFPSSWNLLTKRHM